MDHPVSKGRSAENEHVNMSNTGLPAEVGSIGLGSLLWAKLDLANIDKSSWWPAQVVDERTVSEDNIYNDKVEGGILVRYYGSCIYVWLDPCSSFSEFQKNFKGKNSSPIVEFFALLEENNCGKSCVESNKQSNELKSSPMQKKSEKSTTKRKNIGNDCAVHRAEKNNEIHPPNKQGSPVDDSGKNVRKLRVMRNLGLAAPSGSPY
eukprot:TRINITY_DN17419_c0_g1_i1.p1 TRINITY_DN17419_c0_g1~~TRINITY_DN17419_c0_g1_i1.p1  ORF type:complete len:206 (+),score=50.38 TRINITY_DN17419_c0_g1_i1:461-1078(+)